MAQQRKLKPTEIFDVDFIKHSNIDIQSKYKVGMENGGKWMMFIEKSKLDEVWEKSCKLYDNGQLIGVYDIKCSTNYRDPKIKSHAQNKGALRFNCGPANDEKKIMEIGRNILKMIPYRCDSGYMHFKSDEQSKIGNRHTGQKVNHLYKLEVPGRLSADDFHKMVTSFGALKTRNNSTTKNREFLKKKKFLNSPDHDFGDNF
ncbi:uncharacterized protein LOC123298322 [Chrysoperla carnea]|uniref:uncharacterized protein LOC123298322 n=1 Tax=Chrysoperla carnea TaxID=189513 RepID=UPI001D06BDC6|nr:uncharacterized protein LOC123298322 [Chrysoperla carnea]